MEPQLQNWDNFCRYYSDDLYGTWSRYSAEGELIDSFECIRSFRVLHDGSEISHQNHYIYADGKTESKIFNSYKKPITQGLFLDNCFSWGSAKVEIGNSFFFDTCLRHEDYRASAIARYDERGNLQRMTILSERQGNFGKNSAISTIKTNNELRGWLTRITPDWIVSPTMETKWTQLEDLNDSHLIFHLNDGISVSFPRHIESGKEFFLAMDWLCGDTLLKRGMRHYNSFGFSSLTLEYTQ